MTNDLPVVSFIIPAKNEEEMLPATLDCIRIIVGDHFKYEILVVDNDSNDNTVAVAKLQGAKVLQKATGTIGSLRNAAAKIAKGKCLVFIDADVSLTDKWLKPFIDVMGLLKTDGKIITGSRCSVDEHTGWIANSWFRREQKRQLTTHVGTGHMITSKCFFDQIGGFDELLQTGEDYEFCVRAKREGASIYENHELKVIHYGVPRTLNEFVRREIWHGTGDVQSISALLNSKVVMLALVFLFAHLWLLSEVVVGSGDRVQILIGIIIIIVIITASAWKKYHYEPIHIILRNIVLYYFYFWARSISVINRVLPIISLKTPRAGR